MDSIPTSAAAWGEVEGIFRWSKLHSSQCEEGLPSELGGPCPTHVPAVLIHASLLLTGQVLTKYICHSFVYFGL